MARDFHEWILLPVRWSATFAVTGPRIWWHLFTDSKTSAISTVVVQTLGTLLSAVAARSLGEIAYGRLAALSTCVNWFTVIYGFPTAALVARFIADGRRDGVPFERKCAAAFWLGLGFAVTAAAGSIAFLPWGLPYYGLDGLWGSGVMFSLTYITSMPIAFCLFLLQSFRRLKLWALLNIANSFSFLAGVLIVSLAAPPLTLNGYFGAILAANTVMGGISAWLCVRLLGKRNLRYPDFSVAGAVLRAGRGGWVASLFANMSLLGVNTMIVRFCGKTELGYYQLVTTLGAWVYNAIISVAAPALAEWSRTAAAGHYRSLRRDFRFRQMGTASLAILAAAAVLPFASDLLVGIYGETYRSGAALLRLSVVGWIALGAGCWYNYLFTAVRHPGRVMLPNVVWGTVQVAAGYVFMKWVAQDAMRAMWAYVLAYLAWVAVYEIVYQRTWRKPDLLSTAAATRGPRPA